MSNKTDQKSKTLKINKDLERVQAWRLIWSQFREKGELHYILKNWVFYWGITMALVLFIYEQSENSWEHWGLNLIVALIIFPTTGFIAGRITWKANEKRFMGKKQIYFFAFS
jgi:hypothetical protein